MLPGVLRYEDGIEVNQDIVVITTKGEAICTGELGGVMPSCPGQVKPRDELSSCSSFRAVMTCYLSPITDGSASARSKLSISDGIIDQFVFVQRWR